MTESRRPEIDFDPSIRNNFEKMILNELKSWEKGIWYSFFEKTKNHVLENLAKEFADKISNSILESVEKNILQDSDPTNIKEIFNEFQRLAFSIRDERTILEESNEIDKKSIKTGEQIVRMLKDIESTLSALQMTVSNFNEILNNNIDIQGSNEFSNETNLVNTVDVGELNKTND